MNSNDAPPVKLPFGAAFWYWLRLGFISFGGPAGQIAIMHADLVERKRWISERRFLHALNYCMLLPGPEAQQLATYIGWLLHGTLGGIAAGALFVAPSLVLLTALSWIYVRFGNEVAAIQGVFLGIKPAVAAIVAFAVVRIGKRSLRGKLPFIVAVAAFTAMMCHVPFAWVVLGAAVAGLLGSRVWPGAFGPGGGHGAVHGTSARHEPAGPALLDDHHEIPAHARPRAATLVARLLVGLALWAAPLAALWQWQGSEGTFFRIAWFFTQAALLTFGGAYAVLPFVSEHAIGAGWLSRGQIVDGLALGETTPGPLIMFVCFVGFVGGHAQGGLGDAGAVLGGMVATYFTFLPSFLFILLGAPFIEHARGELRLTAALSGITAAVAGVVMHLAVTIASEVCWPGRESIAWPSVAVAIGALIALWRFKVDVLRVVCVCGLLGIVGKLTGIWAG